MHSVFDWKVIRARLSRSQALTHLAALSIAMELVAMAAKKGANCHSTGLLCTPSVRPSVRVCACSFFCPSSFIVCSLCFVHTRLCVYPCVCLCAGPCVYCVSRHRYDCVRVCVHAAARCGCGAAEVRHQTVFYCRCACFIHPVVPADQELLFVSGPVV